MKRKIKITLEMECSSLLEFENNIGMDDNFDLVDSIIYALDYQDENNNVAYHNNVKITVSKNTYDLPYKEKSDE